MAIFQRFFLIALLALTVSLPHRAHASAPQSQANAPQQLDSGGSAITEKVGARLKIHDVWFRDEEGHAKHVADFLHPGRPTLFALVYYDCPGICTVILNNLLKTLKGMSLTPGKDFEIVAVSVRAAETPELAKKKKEAYLRIYGKPETADGWHFLTGDEKNIYNFSKQLGYYFQFIPGTQEIGHDAGLFFVNSEGVIKRVLFGVEFPADALKLALLEAGSWSTGTLKDQWQALFKKYNYVTRTYQPHSPTGLFIGALAVLLSPIGFVAGKRLRRKKAGPKQG